MSPKYYLIAGTMLISISFNSAICPSPVKGTTSIARFLDAGKSTQSPDKFQQVLGVANDQEIYDALYGGQSLAELAQSRDGNVDELIRLQVNELTEQLNSRLASGSLSAHAYQAQLEELPAIVAESVHTKMA